VVSSEQATRHAGIEVLKWHDRPRNRPNRTSRPPRQA
jgi:hypothetical protein